MNELIQLNASLPALPVQAMPFDGENIDRKVLVPHPDLAGFKNPAEQAIVRLQTNFAPERLPYFRRYYLQPVMVGGRGTGQHTIRYAWNMKRPRSDVTVGVFTGEDLAAAKILIGNQVAGASMTPIRWELCEDRDGEEPIDLGRFDQWSLLKNVTPEDIARLSVTGLTPNIKEWDFDHMYYRKRCQGCGIGIAVNMFAFNIDSARCQKCGTRPFLSAAVRPLFASLANGTDLGSPRARLLHLVQWFGGVGAEVKELALKGLPAGKTPQLLLEQLTERSQLVTAGTDGALTLHEEVIKKLSQLPDGESTAAVAVNAAITLNNVLKRGGPFTEMHQAMATMLEKLVEAK